MKPVTTFNRLMGLRPFDDHNGQPRIFISLLYLVVVWCLMGGSLVFVDKFPSTEHSVEQYITSLCFYPYVINGICSTFLGHCHAKTFLVYKKKMLKVNESLHSLGVTSEYRGSFDCIMLLIIAWSLQGAISIGIGLNAFIRQVGAPIGLYVFFYYIYTTNVGVAILLDFIICVRSVKLRYEKVNDLLEVFATDGFQTQEKEKRSSAPLPVIPLRSNNWMRPWTNVTTLEHLSRPEQQWEYIGRKNWRLRMIKLVHLELCHASNLLFKTFGAQLGLQIRLGLLSITIALYYICVYIIGDNTFPTLTKVQLIGGCIIDCAKLFVLSRACEHAYREASKAMIIVHACYPLVMDAEMKDEIRQFALQLCHCQRGCTDRYFPQMNYSLISRYVSTITTYLVITLQMGESLDSKH